MNAKFVKDTWVQGQKKNRWECPGCHMRFNRDPEKTETNCPRCKIGLSLKKVK